jgi:hypothetical protein
VRIKLLTQRLLPILLGAGLLAAALAAIVWEFTTYRRAFDWSDSPDGSSGERGHPPFSAREVQKLIDEGEPIIVAIHRFRNDCGLWPQRLEDLDPDYLRLTEHQKVIWHYRWFPWGAWSITCFAGYPDAAIRYAIDKDGEGGWQIDTGEHAAALNIPRVEFDGNPPDEETLVANLTRELDRRIAREPDDYHHHRAKVWWLYKYGRLDQARRGCEVAEQRFPTERWPALMGAVLDARLGMFEAAEKRLTGRAAREGDFNWQFMLAQFYQHTDREREALDALHQATRFPFRGVKSHWEASYMQDALGSEAALMAYQAGRQDTVLAVCDRWEEYWESEKRSTDASFLAFRAATYLNQGKFDAAAEQLALFKKMRWKRSHWARNFDPLKQAIDSRDQEFHWDPGQFITPFSLSIPYK